MKLSCFAVALAFIIITPAHARMYQWRDPDTGTTQLSGKPPAWYRSGRIGPRVFVFENGKIIDDTDVVLSDEHRDLMRQRAYIQAEEGRIAAKQKAIESSEAKTALREKATGTEENMTEDLDMEEDILPENTPVEKTGTSNSRKTELSLEDMKQLIEAWEKQQEEKAKQIIGN